MTPSKKVIGLTGGIASGKSTVSRLLAKYDVPIVDADLIARQVVQVGQPAYRAIVETFGEDILSSDGQLDRKALGALVFADKLALSQLEAITHPQIRRQIKLRLAEYKERTSAPFVLLDAALLFETGLDQLCDRVWLVVVDRALQIERLCRRDGIDPAQAAQIIAAQMPLPEKQKRADVLIDNNRSLVELTRQVNRLYAESAI